LLWTDWFLFMLKVDDLVKDNLIALRDPAYYRLDEVNISRRWNWSGSDRNQVFIFQCLVSKAILFYYNSSTTVQGCTISIKFDIS
jgi:hypothetical protein